MNVIEADSQAMRNQIEQLRNSLAATNSTVSELEESIQALQSMWAGEAHNEFVNQCILNREQMQDMCEVIENIIESMLAAVAEYDCCEGAVRDTISSFRLP